jgi:hypothetical protein
LSGKSEARLLHQSKPTRYSRGSDLYGAETILELMNPFDIRGNLAYIGLHVSLLGAMVGFLFLERYLQLVKLAQKGYGPYTTLSNIAGLSAILVLIDLFVLRSALRGSQTDKRVSLVVPALLAGGSLFILVANNL